MRFKLTILAALAALSLIAAEPVKQVVASKAPAIDTAKLWRLVAQAQQLRQQLQVTPAAKAAEKADEAVTVEQQRLGAICGTEFVLGYQQDQKADNAGDLICVPKPPAEAPAPAKKEK